MVRKLFLIFLFLLFSLNSCTTSTEKVLKNDPIFVFSSPKSAGEVIACITNEWSKTSAGNTQKYGRPLETHPSTDGTILVWRMEAGVVVKLKATNNLVHVKENPDGGSLSIIKSRGYFLSKNRKGWDPLIESTENCNETIE